MNNKAKLIFEPTFVFQHTDAKSCINYMMNIDDLETDCKEQLNDYYSESLILSILEQKVMKGNVKREWNDYIRHKRNNARLNGKDPWKATLTLYKEYLAERYNLKYTTEVLYRDIVNFASNEKNAEKMLINFENLILRYRVSLQYATELTKEKYKLKDNEIASKAYSSLSTFMRKQIDRTKLTQIQFTDTLKTINKDILAKMNIDISQIGNNTIRWQSIDEIRKAVKAWVLRNDDKDANYLPQSKTNMKSKHEYMRQKTSLPRARKTRKRPFGKPAKQPYGKQRFGKYIKNHL